MSPFDRKTLSDEELLDLLVDDELTESERRELLGRLDRMPDGWRRCALAFLEAQCWKKEGQAIIRDGARPVQRAEPDAVAVPARNRWAFGWRTLLAMAACFLAALGLGLAIGGRGGRSGPTASQVATTQAKPPMPSEAKVSTDVHQPQPSGPAWRMVTLATDRGGGAGPAIHLPAVERDQLDRDWLTSLPLAMPAEVVKMLEASGLEVRQSRRLVPVPMQDGRHLIVPLDQVELRPVRGPAY